MTNRLVLGLAMALLVAAGTPAHAGVDPGDLCKEKKAKAAGLRAFMLLKAFGKNIKKPNVEAFVPDVSKARSKFEKGFTMAEKPGECVLTGDSVDVEPVVDGCVEELITLIAKATTTSTTTTTATTTSTTTLPLCGDGIPTGYEQCDQADLGGATCEDLGFNLNGALGCTEECVYDVSGCLCQALPATGQTTCWDDTGTSVGCSGTGHDGEALRGAPLAYVDNGDGTISDLNTGLMWEKKDDNNTAKEIHDKDTLYTWNEAFTVFLPKLNGTCDGDESTGCTDDSDCTGIGNGLCGHAGYTDWRVPNLKEIHSIINYEVFAPAVDAAFDTGCSGGCTVTTCSCTRESVALEPEPYYWSSTSSSPVPSWVWAGNFNVGGVTARSKAGIPYYVRAVRGGP